MTRHFLEPATQVIAAGTSTPPFPYRLAPEDAGTVLVLPEARKLG
jgi:hypothetical protein